MTHPAWYTPVCFLVFAALSWALFQNAASPDLQATWIAGHFYAIGAHDQVYAGNEGYFSMLPASGWDAFLAEEGHEGITYPFVYPPLWAALASWIVPVVPFETAKVVANIVNPLLMAGMVWLAARTVEDREVSVQMMTFAGCAVLIVTLPGLVALQQNQPHILVAFLIVLAIERARAGAPVAAGTALAVAAALKLFPALLVLAWIAGGRWTAAATFAVVGATLGLASVWLAGWPLHEVFLDEIDSIRATVMVTHFTYGIDAILARLFHQPDLIEVEASVGGWIVLQKPALWQMASTIALASILVVSSLAIRSERKAGRTPDVLFWPILLALSAFVSPLAWGYYYLPAMAFLPHLLDRFGLRAGGLMLAALALPITPASFSLLVEWRILPNMPALVGTLTMLAMTGLFALAVRRRARVAAGPLRATPVSL